MLRQAKWAWGATHRRPRRPPRRDRGRDGRSPLPGIRRTRALAAFTSRPRRLARDPHGLRRRQGHVPGGHVRGARRGAEPALHRATPVHRARPLRRHPAGAGLGARGSRRRSPPGRSTRCRSTSPASKATHPGSRSSRAGMTTTSSGLSGAHRMLYRPARALGARRPRAAAAARRRRVAAWIVVGAVVLSIGWSTWAETAAATYSNDFSRPLLQRAPEAARTGSTRRPAASRPSTSARRSPTRTASGRWSSGTASVRQRLEPRRHRARPRAGAHAGPDRDGRTARRRSRLRVRGDRQRASRSPATTVASRARPALVRIAKPLRLQNSLAGVFSDGWIGSKVPAGQRDRRLQPVRRARRSPGRSST